ncbi:MAG: DNA-processing protein DprA [Yoonia sp.]|nr:DNA-processing protein DprA [Yoonia sp.]
MTGKHTPSTHSPFQPSSEDITFCSLRLLRSRRVGPATYHRLMREHGTAAAALDALPEIAAAAGVTDYKICPEGVVIAELNSGRANKSQLLIAGQAGYPAALNDLSDAPPLLWALGNLSLLQKPMIALVGARNASSLGTRMAKKLAADLGDAGFVVVSGLARGVDTAAHIAALPTGTIAVQAGGVDVIYPIENSALAQDIAKSGLRVSEMPMGVQPQARHFPARNRIISGLACATVVIEAAAKSGSLITARNALDQSRDVFAVPGHPFDARTAGCNMLIRDGATLIRSADDVIEAVGQIAVQPIAERPVPEPKPQRSLRDMAGLHAQILERLGPSPVAEDQLIRDLGAASTIVAPAIVSLELDGRIKRQRGGLLSLAN